MISRAVNDVGDPQLIECNELNHLRACINSPLSAFGELLTSSLYIKTSD